MNETEREAILSELQILRAMVDFGINSTGPVYILGQIRDSLDDFADRIDGWCASHMKIESKPCDARPKIDQPKRHTTNRLQTVYNILRHQLGIEKAHCGYAGYHITGYGVIRLGHAETTIQKIIKERKERKKWQRSGDETPQGEPGATSSTVPPTK
jgi:hypothetical protein